MLDITSGWKIARQDMFLCAQCCCPVLVTNTHTHVHPHTGGDTHTHKWLSLSLQKLTASWPIYRESAVWGASRISAHKGCTCLFFRLPGALPTPTTHAVCNGQPRCTCIPSSTHLAVFGCANECPHTTHTARL